MIFKGFRFGMMLQLAIGPISLYVFQVASSRGFLVGELATGGVVLIDGSFILAAILGIGSLIERKKVKMGLKIFGSLIMFVFGLTIVLGQFNINLLPSFNFANSPDSGNVFVSAIILTAANPMTIIFWAGVFSSKIAEGDMNQRNIYIFGMGALLSSVFSLTVLSILGSAMKSIIPPVAIEVLNILVGLLLAFFGLRMLFKKDKSAQPNV